MALGTAKGQPVEAAPRSGLAQQLGSKSLRCCRVAGGAPGCSTAARSCMLLPSGQQALSALPSPPLSSQRVDPGDTPILEFSEGCSMPTSASSPLSRTPPVACGAPRTPPSYPPPSCLRGEALTPWFLLSHFFLESVHIKARSLMFSAQQGCGD